MALNERSGLFTVEVVAGLAIVGYLLYVTEKARSAIVDTHPVYYTESLYYSHQIDKPIPTHQSTQSDIDDFNTAANWVLAHSEYFSPEQITKAQAWVQKVTADPRYLIAGYDVDLILQIKSDLRSPWPPVPSQSLTVLKRYAEAKYVTDHPEWFTPEDLALANQFKRYVETQGAEGGTSPAQSGPPPPSTPTPEQLQQAVAQASCDAQQPPQSNAEWSVQQAAALRAAQCAAQAQQQANQAQAQAEDAARQDAASRGSGERYNY